MTWVTKAIGGFSVGGVCDQLMNAFGAAGSHPQQELHYLTAAIYMVAVAICFKQAVA